MSRVVRCGLIQASNALGANHPLPKIKKAMIDKHLKLIEQAARKKVKILCLQELFYGRISARNRMFGGTTSRSAYLRVPQSSSCRRLQPNIAW